MSVLILAEHDGKQFKKATRQAITAAKAWQSPVHVLVAGADLAAIVGEVAAIAGVEQVLSIDAPHLSKPLAEDIAELLVRLGRDYEAIIAPHTAFSRNVLPRVAALLDVAMVADVVAIQAPKTYVRPMYAGNVYATVTSADALQILTVRATSFAAAEDGGSAKVVALDAPAGTERVCWLGETRNVSDRPELASARVVISGGRSLGSAEQFDAVLGPLARTLGAALGATRAAVDAGFAPNDIQVGTTGTVVAPEIYFAVGVSGAPQHIAGMKDSKVVVAINHDPDAPIFQVADYGLVADLFVAIPELTKAFS